MDLRLATLKAVSFYLLHNVSTLKAQTASFKDQVRTAL
jgi:hypothetical protein